MLLHRFVTLFFIFLLSTRASDVNVVATNSLQIEPQHDYGLTTNCGSDQNQDISFLLLALTLDHKKRNENCGSWHSIEETKNLDNGISSAHFIKRAHEILVSSPNQPTISEVTNIIPATDVSDVSSVPSSIAFITGSVSVINPPFPTALQSTTNNDAMTTLEHGSILPILAIALALQFNL